jgi:hypothetical protein
MEVRRQHKGEGIADGASADCWTQRHRKLSRRQSNSHDSAHCCGTRSRATIKMEPPP